MDTFLWEFLPMDVIMPSPKLSPCPSHRLQGAQLHEAQLNKAQPLWAQLEGTELEGEVRESQPSVLAQLSVLEQLRIRQQESELRNAAAVAGRPSMVLLKGRRTSQFKGQQFVNLSKRNLWMPLPTEFSCDNAARSMDVHQGLLIAAPISRHSDPFSDAGKEEDRRASCPSCSHSTSVAELSLSHASAMSSVAAAAASVCLVLEQPCAAEEVTALSYLPSAYKAGSSTDRA